MSKRKSSSALASSAAGADVGLLTGGIDKPYAFGLAKALASRNVRVDFIGSDEVDGRELDLPQAVRSLKLRGSQLEDAGLVEKAVRIVAYYARLLRYASMEAPAILHILWNNKFEALDRTLLMLYYKLLGKRVVLTAHNVNAARRDAKDSSLNRATLRIQYRLADHIFVHTNRMKAELVADFGVDERLATVIPLGINNCAPHTELTTDEARRRLGIGEGERAILFFGAIGPYKGVDCLVSAFQRFAGNDARYRLLVIGKPKVGCESYVEDIRRSIGGHASRDQVIQRLEYISDEETEVYFKAADVLVLPYTEVSQSGVLVLGYSFGVPVIAADVGSLRDEIVEGETGYLFAAGDVSGLAAALQRYFDGDLFKGRHLRRQQIRAHGDRLHSWEVVAEKTLEVYADMLKGRRAPGGSMQRRQETEPGAVVPARDVN